MAEYLNQKEDIIKIELTSYGIERLSKGRLNPVYYSFHDDEVYYGDSDTTEIYDKLEKDDHTRIYKETSYVTNYKKTSNTEPEDYYSSIQPMGTADRKTSLHSSLMFKIHSKDVEIASASFVSPSPSRIQIPPPPPETEDGSGDDPIEHEEIYKVSLTEIDLGYLDYCLKAVRLTDYDFENPEESIEDLFGDYPTNLFEDESFIKIDAPDFMFSLEEMNVTDEFDNFEVEFYEYDEDSEKYKEITQLPKYTEGVIKNGLLLDNDNEDEISIYGNRFSGNTTISELFLIEADDEIPDEIIEKYFNKEKSSVQKKDSSAEIYSNALSGPFGEDC